MISSFQLSLLVSVTVHVSGIMITICGGGGAGVTGGHAFTDVDGGVSCRDGYKR